MMWTCNVGEGWCYFLHPTLTSTLSGRLFFLWRWLFLLGGYTSYITLFHFSCGYQCWCCRSWPPLERWRGCRECYIWYVTLFIWSIVRWWRRRRRRAWLFIMAPRRGRRSALNITITWKRYTQWGGRCIWWGFRMTTLLLYHRRLLMHLHQILLLGATKQCILGMVTFI